MQAWPAAEPDEREKARTGTRDRSGRTGLTRMDAPDSYSPGLPWLCPVMGNTASGMSDTAAFEPGRLSFSRSDGAPCSWADLLITSRS